MGRVSPDAGYSRGRAIERERGVYTFGTMQSLIFVGLLPSLVDMS